MADENVIAGVGSDDNSAETIPKVFTQEEVNNLVKEGHKAFESKYKAHSLKLSDELNALRTRANLSSSEREDLDKRLEQLQSQLMTKEELAKQEREKMSSKHKEEVTQLTAARDEWKTRFTKSTIMRALTDAAVTNNAFHPSQLVAILGPDTELTDDFEARIKVKEKNEQGESITLDLTVDEAVKRMKENDIYKNLFKDTGVGGIGSSSGSSYREPDIAALARDPVAYRKARKEGKI